jgi:hypothetical protein
MKFLFIFALFVTVNIYAADITPAKHYKFDVKTKFSEKKAEAPTKAGLITYLKTSGWSEVVEFKENYAVWLKNVHKTDGTNTMLTFDLELTKPSFFKQGQTLKSKHFELSYNTGNVSKKVNLKMVLGEMQKVNDQIATTGNAIPFLSQATQYTGVVNGVLGLVSNLLPDATAQDKSEAAIIGGAAYAQIQQWVIDIEKGK